MAFKSRLSHLIIVAILVSVALYTYDAFRSDLWANVAVGLSLCIGLAILVATSTPTRGGAEPIYSEGAAPAPLSLHMLLDQMPTPVVSYTQGEMAQAVNRAARNLFKTDDAIILGAADVISVLSEPHSRVRPIVTIEGRLYAASVSEIVTENGAVRIGLLTDVQMEIHKAEASALRDTLHILSHEIMNSLTPVASLADIADSYLAEEKGEAVRAAREALEMLSRRATNLAKFIEAYRSVARLPEPVLQPVEPPRLLQDIMNILAHSPSAATVEFSIDYEDDLPTLLLDESQASQAIINVLTNAIEATMDNEIQRRVSIRVRRAPQDVIIEIADNGPGVSDSVIAGLFTAFATTKSKGTGTGLNLARQIALAHGGNLQLVGGGAGDTVFEFSFPTYPAPLV